MRKRTARVLLALLFLVLAFVLLGTGAMLAFFVLCGVAVLMVLVARLYPQDRAREDRADEEDRF